MTNIIKAAIGGTIAISLMRLSWDVWGLKRTAKKWARDEREFSERMEQHERERERMEEARRQVRGE